MTRNLFGKFLHLVSFVSFLFLVVKVFFFSFREKQTGAAKRRKEASNNKTSNYSCCSDTNSERQRAGLKELKQQKKYSYFSPNILLK